MINETVLNSLPTSAKVDKLPAELRNLAGETLYTFLYNPDQTESTLTIQHGSTATHESQAPILQFQTATKSLRLNELLLDGYSAGKSVRRLIEGIEDLARQSVPLTFVWGSENFGPALITNSVTSRVSLRLSGDPGFAYISFEMSLIASDTEKPPEQPQTVEEENLNQDTIETAISNLTGDINPTEGMSPSMDRSIALTDRQRGEGVGVVRAYLEQNQANLSAETKKLFRDATTTLDVDPSGESFLLSPGGKAKKLGIYDGRSFNVESGI